MKKILALMMSLLLLVSMTACAETQDDGKYVIGICQIEPHPALDAATDGFKKAVTDALGADNVEFLVQNAAGDSNTLNTIINDYVSRNVDLILANATPVLQTAAAATTTTTIAAITAVDAAAKKATE